MEISNQLVENLKNKIIKNKEKHQNQITIQKERFKS